MKISTPTAFQSTLLFLWTLSIARVSVVQAQHPDIVVTVNVPGDNPGSGWGDSYSVGDECYCETTFDHDIGPFQMETPVGWMTVEEACTMIGPGPGSAGRPKYNDVQCGNGPPNNAGDEHTCPGRVDIGRGGCGHIGPKWKFGSSPSPPPISTTSAPTLPPVASTPSPTKSPVVGPPTANSVFIDCGPGDEAYMSGTYWTDTTGQSIANTGIYAQADFQQARSGSGFTYTIGGFAAGVTASVTLGWAELWFGACATDKRKFNVEVNGAAMVTEYDVGNTAGGCYSAVFETQSFQASAAGEFAIAFSKGSKNNPLINIIDIQV
jgi:hypothetical protein